MIYSQQSLLPFDFQEMNTSGQKIRPFLKWAGGKTQLLKYLHLNLPKGSIDRYFEPFLGGGALFFSLQHKKTILSDSNEELINCYKVIKEQLNELLIKLQQHKNAEEYFYTVRNQNVEEMDDVSRASRLIFLNRTCFNGLYRVNKSGKFNTPYGKYKNPKIIDEENLRRVSTLLKSVTLISTDFENVTKLAQKKDFIYFDPPYLPVSQYADFKRYTKESFYEKDHIRLARLFKKLDKIGCYVMLSNSYTEFTMNLYKDYNVKTVFAKRLINKVSSSRGSIPELLITNY